jgi:LPXTG-site transpeptidase (sortase) family protein
VGTQGASGVVITETVPDHATIDLADNAGWTCTGTTPAETCTYDVGGVAVGASGSVSFMIIIDDPLPAGVDQITNLVLIGDDGKNGDDLNSKDNEASHDTPVDAAPDLSIVKDDNEAIAYAGEDLIYTLTYHNSGNQGATGVVITETVPANTVFNAAASTPGWACEADGHAGDTCTFEVAGEVAAGGGGTVTFVVTVIDHIPAGVTTIDNVVTIGDDDENGDDSTPEDNTDTTTTDLIALPDIRVVKSDGISLTVAGRELTYTLTVSNIGGKGATGVVLIDTLPVDGITFVSASGIYLFDPLTGIITWEAFDLPSGDNTTRTVTIRLDDPLDAAITTIVNTTTVVDDGQNGEDPDLDNNTDTDTDTIATASKTLIESLHQADLLPKVAIGELLVYEVRLKIGPGSVDNLKLTDVLDRGLAFVKCESIAGNGSPSNLSSLPDNLTKVCENPQVSTEPVGSTNPADEGRKVVFDFGTVTNSGKTAETLVVRYEVVVLNNVENVRDVKLNNTARWDWTGGSLVNLNADEVTIIEPELMLAKEVNTNVAFPGSVVTYTLTIAHTSKSNADAYDVMLIDTIPNGLSYVPGSLKFVSGQAPTLLDATDPKVMKIGWDIFYNHNGETIIEFKCFVTNLPVDTEVKNDASVSWSSLPGDVSDPQSEFSDPSGERAYVPGSSVDIYGSGAVARFVIAEGLPSTGFAPGMVSVVGQQPDGKAYQDLGEMTIEIPSLGVNLKIVGVPYTSTGWDLSWLTNAVGYMSGTAFPTTIGNTGLTAHVYDSNGQPGPFINLHTLKWGDVIYLHMGGQKYRYEVRQVQQYLSPKDFSSLKNDGYVWVTLLTCQGYDETSNSYRYRVAVRAVLVNVVKE